LVSDLPRVFVADAGVEDSEALADGSDGVRCWLSVGDRAVAAHGAAVAIDWCDADEGCAAAAVDALQLRQRDDEGLGGDRADARRGAAIPAPLRATAKLLPDGDGPSDYPGSRI
jgi:hypothetical protein